MTHSTESALTVPSEHAASFPKTPAFSSAETCVGVCVSRRFMTSCARRRETEGPKARREMRERDERNGEKGKRNGREREKRERDGKRERERGRKRAEKREIENRERDSER